jgi:hypothetical protein
MHGPLSEVLDASKSISVSCSKVFLAIEKARAKLIETKNGGRGRKSPSYPVTLVCSWLGLGDKPALGKFAARTAEFENRLMRFLTIVKRLLKLGRCCCFDYMDGISSFEDAVPFTIIDLTGTIKRGFVPQHAGRRPDAVFEGILLSLLFFHGGPKE